MMRITVLFALLIASIDSFAAQPFNALYNGGHAANNVVSEIVSLGGTVGAGGIFVDQTCAGPSECAPTYLWPYTYVGPAQSFPYQATNASGVFYTEGTATTSNNEPYGVLGESYAIYNLSLDQNYGYTSWIASNANAILPMCGTFLSTDYPPVTIMTILVDTFGPASVGSGYTANCGYAPGISFSMSPNYLGIDTSSPSATTGGFTGMVAVVRKANPTWNSFDVQGAFRQTASNWSNGYIYYNSAGPSFGYGDINYTAVSSVGSTANIYLQPPASTYQNFGYYVTITLYPFASTRRAKEVIYTGGTWPSVASTNELTAAQIASAGGTKVYDDGGATGIQTFNYGPAASGSVTFTVLTLDASGNGSRIESFSQSTQSFTVGNQCLNH
jgi:hypothetical protein